jgi:hydroxypyruvate isomerase
MLAGAGAGVTAMLPVAAAMSDNRRSFHVNYAPHPGTFKASAGDDIVAQLEFAADAGFTAWEDNDMRGREIAEQQRIAAAMQRLNVQMGVFVGADISWQEAGITRGDATSRQKFLDDIRASVDVAKRVHATWMTVVPGHVDPRQQPHFQMAHVVETLKQACAILEPHGLVIVLEALNFRDHPGMFLTEIPQAYAICKAVNSPACKILFDIYHQQISEGNLIPNIESAWDEIAYFQVGDNPGRNEPTTGEINYRRVFEFIHGKGFTGVLGMEHGNSIAGVAGDLALIDAYRKSDNFQ